MRLVGRTFAAAVAALAVATFLAPSAHACSPAFDPTIAALGPGQVVVVGTTGERVEGGRLFHVERAYSDTVTSTPIVIAFKEGEPVGDCSYPVSDGQRLIIAPATQADGTLTADLATLQADPRTNAGLTYIAEAEALFGPGFVPPPAPSVPDARPADDGPGPVIILLAVALVALVIGIGVTIWWRRGDT